MTKAIEEERMKKERVENVRKQGEESNRRRREKIRECFVTKLKMEWDVDF